MDFGGSWPISKENDYANHHRYLPSMGRAATHRAGAIQPADHYPFRGITGKSAPWAAQHAELVGDWRHQPDPGLGFGRGRGGWDPGRRHIGDRDPGDDDVLHADGEQRRRIDHGVGYGTGGKTALYHLPDGNSGESGHGTIEHAQLGGDRVPEPDRQPWRGRRGGDIGESGTPAR